MTQKRNKWGTWKQYLKVCEEIYDERGRLCEKCGIWIYEMKTWNFNHLKGRRKNFLNKETIQLLCHKCHSKYHGIKTLNAEWLN